MNVCCWSEDDSVPQLLKKDQPRSSWDDEDADDDDVKESWEDEDEPEPVCLSWCGDYLLY